jgi:hypothetical protein
VSFFLSFVFLRLVIHGNVPALAIIDWLRRAVLLPRALFMPLLVLLDSPLPRFED